MDKKEILEKAIAAATRNGWDMFGLKKYKIFFHEFKDTADKDDVEIKFIRGADVCYYTINDVIYNHDFARAIFGEEEDGKEFVNGVYGEQPKYRWKHHLQQMVIAENPLAYLAEHMV